MTPSSRAAGTRVRPILMTAIATIIALMPLVLSATKARSSRPSWARWSLAASSPPRCSTLIVVPVVYSLLDSVRRRFSREQSDLEPAAAPEPAHSNGVAAEPELVGSGSGAEAARR